MEAIKMRLNGRPTESKFFIRGFVTAGVGYSFSMDEDYTTGDHETATANYAALKDFFKQFPEFAKHEFYISGEGKSAEQVP